MTPKHGKLCEIDAEVIQFFKQTSKGKVHSGHRFSLPLCGSNSIEKRFQPRGGVRGGLPYETDEDVRRLA